ncbi:MAG: FUSC family protein [Puniceicoccales bacterium]|jgi:uncharacterized membrane protein YccC|nr:FUSC family protein [Puniceicoccales bacterium]
MLAHALRPSRTLRDRSIFSLKTFLAAMAGLYISFRLDLSEPGWAALTAYVVSQPLSGMMLSKSFSRILGTVIGAVMSIILVATLSDARELFVLAIALWIGGCLYWSVFLRDAPTAYGAMLSGYTAAIIGFPAVLAPETVFDTAVARCLEISIGIVCATIMSRIVFPSRTGDVLRATMTRCLDDVARWAVDTLRGHRDDDQGQADVRKLIADTSALDSLRIHAVLDSPEMRNQDKVVRALHGRLLTLSSYLVALHDRLKLLRQQCPEAMERLTPLLEGTALLLSTDRDVTVVNEALESRIRAARPSFEAMHRNPVLVLEYNILQRLLDVLRIWRETASLKQAFASEQVPVDLDEIPEMSRYRDHTLALVASAVSVVAVITTSAFWIYTGWDHGASAATFSGMLTCIMASHDNPVKSSQGFFKATVFSAVVAAIYLFAVFPAIDGFPMLVAVLAVLYLPTGIMLTSARYGTLATPFLLNIFALLSIHNIMTIRFDGFINSTSALLVGMLSALIMFRLLRPVGVDWAIRRLTRGVMRDLAQIAAAKKPEPRISFESRMFDRINSLRLRLNPSLSNERAHLEGILTALRMGLNMLVLQRNLPSMPEPLARSIRRTMDQMSAHFRRYGTDPERFADNTVISAINQSIADTFAAKENSHAKAVDTLVALHSLRNTLTQHPGFFGIKMPSPETGPNLPTSQAVS